MSEAEVNNLIAQRKTSTSYTINITFHIIRKSDGSDGATIGEINDELARINAFFAASDIQFVLESINEVLNDTYAATNADWFSITRDILYPTYGATNRIDAFIFNSMVDGVNGNAFNIPSDYFAASENRLNTGNWAHEIGHDLGLLHTHERFEQSCPSPLIENVNGSNCATAGDFCCDTPADPNLDNATWSLATCTYTDGITVDCNGAIYSPNVRNLMSYGWTCRDHFTTCQMNRMHAELMSGTVGTKLASSFLATVDGDGKFNGTLEVDRPATFVGDVPLTIDATASTGWYSGLKTTYGTNTTYIFGIDDVNGGIEVVKQNFFYAPILASGFSLSPAADHGNSLPNLDSESINALEVLSEIGSIDFSNENPTNTDKIPSILRVTGVSGVGGLNGHGISLNNWLMISTLGLQQLDRQHYVIPGIQERIISIASKNDQINQRIQEATYLIERIENKQMAQKQKAPSTSNQRNEN
ncbi:MAG: hypothetical protein HKN76_14350 [Saprospiraceae bacterium]|nr:hypothetical protein [Saprospiraceae bacterium]